MKQLDNRTLEQRNTLCAALVSLAMVYLAMGRATEARRVLFHVSDFEDDIPVVRNIRFAPIGVVTETDVTIAQIDVASAARALAEVAVTICNPGLAQDATRVWRDAIEATQRTLGVAA